MRREFISKVIPLGGEDSAIEWIRNNCRHIKSIRKEKIQKYEFSSFGRHLHININYLIVDNNNWFHSVKIYSRESEIPLILFGKIQEEGYLEVISGYGEYYRGGDAA